MSLTIEEMNNEMEHLAMLFDALAKKVIALHGYSYGPLAEEMTDIANQLERMKP